MQNSNFNENEIKCETFQNDRKKYNISLRIKKDDNKQMMIVVTEGLKRDMKYYPNKIRIYGESFQDFFDKIKIIEKEIKEIKDGNSKR